MNPAGLYVNSATVNSKGFTTQDNGSLVLSSSGSASISCSIQPAGSSEGLEMGRDLGKKRAIMYYAPGTTIDIGYTVTSGGVVYKVIGPPRDVAGRGVMMEVDLEQEV